MLRHVAASALVGSAAIAVLAARSSMPGPDPAALRAAVHRSLPLLQSSADTWFAKRQCSSCHHQGLGTLAATVAGERGFSVDQALLATQLSRTFAPARGWGEKFVTGGVSINEAVGQSYRAVGVGSAGGPASLLTDAVAHLLAGQQHVSGRWPSYSRRLPLEDSEFTATALTIRVLGLYPIAARQAEFDARIARARTWLTSAKPADTEDRAMQLLGLAWAGVPPAELQPRAEALLAEQRTDGGWAQIATRASDAYATGQALAALNQAARVPRGHLAVQRGLAYLLSTQESDGSWHVPTRRTWGEGLPYFETGYPHGKDQFISYAGAAWATIALALADRDDVSPALMGRSAASGRRAAASLPPDGLTPLMWAALKGSVADVDRLLAGGADVNAQSPGGVTALMCAVRDPAIVRRLLAAGAEPGARTSAGHTALLIAAGYSGASKSVDLLLARGAATDLSVTSGLRSNETPLARALSIGGLATAAKLIAAGAKVEGTAKGPSLLMRATYYGDVEAVRWLVARGASPERSASQPSTPLMVAAEDGRPDIVEALLEAGADVHATDDVGQTALIYAAETHDRGTTEVVDLLLKAGARTTVTGRDGKTASALARSWGKSHVATRLERP